MPLPSWLRKPVLPIPPEYNPVTAFVPRLPTLMDFVPFPVPRHNVVLEFFQRMGFKTLQYGPVGMNSVVLIDECLRLYIDILVLTVIVYTLYYATASASPQVRRATAFVACGCVLFWPLVVGRGQSAVFNFFRPAIGFRSSLLAWDIFQIRPMHEVKSWSRTLFVAHLWFFPKEEEQLAEREKREGFKRDPRIQSLKQLPVGLVQFFFALLLLLTIPPKEVYANMHWLTYRVYCFTFGVDIFMLLSSGGLFLFNMFGLITGIEQEAMFQNPFFTTRLRHFWSRWNRAIATVLHRVIFGGKKTFQTLDQRKAMEKRKAGEAQGASTAVDAQGGSAQQRKRAAGSSQAEPAAAPSKRDVSSFLTKSGLALATFFVSGLFHEYLLFFASPYKFGYNTVFFMLNGLGTVLSSAVERFCPSLHRRIPGWLRCIIMLIFYACVSPFFFAPFIESNFFAHFQEMAFTILPSDMPRPRPMFVYLFGE
ncbi:hypothetical protein MOBT1_003107 [Malassezia obtusa]|uniref:Wax synthase domain-containing protein n=1 Tax=Malassezia obtusa TaxID=76774 RepID=A0AAF0IUD0_9BASI|nr:hypothetical protein MOBT1_003107 [Malassezia obtusa]